MPRSRRSRVWAIVVAISAIVLLFASLGDARRPSKRRPLAGRGQPIKSIPSKPWTLDGPVRPFAEVCFEDRSDLRGLSEQDAGRWLEKTGNRPFSLKPGGDANCRLVRFQGMARLKTWVPDATLRLSFQSVPLRIHFWAEGGGVSLYHYPGQPLRWVAYGCSQSPDSQPPHNKPATGLTPMPLLATDDYRGARFVDDTIEVRYQDGAIVLTKGDVRLLTAPMVAAPTAVYIEASGETLLRDLALCRSGPAPDMPVRNRRPVLSGQTPAQLVWKESLPGDGQFERLAGGSVELRANKTDMAAWVALAMPREDLYEVTLDIEGASDGTGVFFGGEAEATRHCVEFNRDPATGWTILRHTQPGSVVGIEGTARQQQPAWFASPRQRLRIVSAAGLLRCWTSSDGVHWSSILVNKREAGAWRYVGLYVDSAARAQPGVEPTSRCIRLRAIEVRRLDGLTSLVAGSVQDMAAVRLAVLKAPRDADVAAWRKRVAETRPPEIDVPTWQAACELATLVAGPHPDLGRVVLDDLVRYGLARGLPTEATVHMLQDASLIWDASQGDDAVRYAAHWETLGRRLVGEASWAEFEQFRHAWLAASLSSGDARVEAMPWTLARDRLIALLGRQSWYEAQQWALRVIFWHNCSPQWSTWLPEQETLRRLTAWTIEQTATPQGAIDRNNASVAEMRWIRSSVVPISRESYNLLSDLEGDDRDDRRDEDVAQRLSSVAMPHEGGLVHDTDDPQLSTSFPVAVQLMVRRNPMIRKAMADRFKEADLVRINQAMAGDDLAALEDLLVQYCGTEAAAAIEQWFGDRLLAQGDFLQALARYRRAQLTVAVEQRAALAARIRLAAAAVGLVEGEATKAPILLADRQIPPKRFEQWVQELLARNVAARGNLAAPPQSLGLSPCGFQATQRLVFDGDAGQNPAGIPATSAGVDWAGRHISLLPRSDVLLVSNRIQIAALEPSAGRRRWTFSLGAPAEQGQTHLEPLGAFGIVVVGDSVFTTILTKNRRPEILCLELATGKKRWMRDHAPHQPVSDPLVLGERLFFLTAERLEQGAAVSWSEIDRDTGNVLSRKPVLHLPAGWNGIVSSQTALAGDRIVVAMPGMVLCFDLSGSILWLRSDLALPANLEPLPGRQCLQAPLVVVGRVYVNEPSVHGVGCYDLETGQVIWRQGVLGMRRVIGLLEGGRLVVDGGDAVRALRADTGRLLWRCEVPGALEAVVCPSPKLILCAQAKLPPGYSPLPPPPGSPPPPLIDRAVQLLWIDLETGQIKGESPLPTLKSKRPGLGPMFATEGRLWCFSDVLDGNGLLLPARSLFDLSPSGPAQARGMD